MSNKRGDDLPVVRLLVRSSQLDLLQSLHIVYAGDLAHAADDIFEVFEVRNIENDIDVSLRVRATHLHIADVGFSVADHRGNLLQHAETIVAENRKLHRIGTRGSLIAGPFYIDPAFRLIEKVHDVGAIHGVDGNTFAASHIADNILAPDGIAATRPIHQQITVAFHADSVVPNVSTENPPHHASYTTGFLPVSIGDGRGRSRS